MLLVTDGSHKDDLATAAFILTCPSLCKTDGIMGWARTTGDPSVQDSYRAELTGILAGIYHLNRVLEQEGWVEPLRLTVCCDNIESLKVSFDTTFHPQITSAYQHFDLIQSIRRSAQLRQLHISWLHVKGHQDKTGGTFDIYTQLNILMDTECRNERERLLQEQAPTTYMATPPNWEWFI
jgi:hypothetical protein